MISDSNDTRLWRLQLLLITDFYFLNLQGENIRKSGGKAAKICDIHLHFNVQFPNSKESRLIESPHSISKSVPFLSSIVNHKQ